MNRRTNVIAMYPKLSRNKYAQGVKRAWTPLEASLIMTSQHPGYYQDVLQTPTHGLKNIFKRTDHVWFFEESDLKELGELVLHEWMTAESFERSKRALIDREHLLLAATEGDVESFLRAYRDYIPSLFTIWRVDEPAATLVAVRIHTRLPQDEAEVLIDALKVPLQDNLYKQEEFELVQANDLETHAEKFRWLYSRYGERDAYTAEQAAKKLEGMDRVAFLNKYHEEKEQVKQAISKAKDLLDPDEKHLIDVLQFILYYRTQRTDIMHLVMNIYRPKLEAYAQSKGLSIEEAMYCHVDELLGKVPLHEVLRQRLEKQAFGFQDDVFTIMTEAEAQSIDQFFTEEVVQTNEIRGQSACRGYVRGHVTLLHSKADMEKVQEGDILVAGMTNPNHLPAMKRAAAIITDEGGITCHAAIVSRELNKPCVIGTKAATKILKDGDEVEVDANTGVVKILSRA